MNDVVPPLPRCVRQRDCFLQVPKVLMALTEPVTRQLDHDLLNPPKRQILGDDLTDLAAFAYERPCDPVEDVFEHRKVFREPPRAGDNALLCRGSGEREMFRTDIGPRKKSRYRDKSDSKHNPNNGASNRSGPESLFKVGGRKRHVCRLL
jgi:hypothetical protein